ncbi:MAG: tetratricopeptide repeat protein [Verrucomicrobia bacterium]|nr:tetratricopeptide repeat protein [Verrucomicrobiota bacterium]MDE3098959.1 tetratricopeptide repeat protein [Verrucomicrobiota bacterium]
MPSQDATALYLLKLWPRIEASKYRIAAAAAVVVIAVFLFWYFSMESQQKEIAAGRALTVLVTNPHAGPDAYFALDQAYPGTVAGQRAFLGGAELLFVQNDFTNAQARFQQFLDNHPESQFSTQAKLGVAACEEAEGQTQMAIGSYQGIVNSSAEISAANPANFALAELYENAGRLNDALQHYMEVAQSDQSGALGVQATLHYLDFKNQVPPAALSAPAFQFHQ